MEPCPQHHPLTLLELKLYTQVLTQQILDNGLHVTADPVAVALNQLHDALRRHEETVAVGPLLQGGCVVVDHAGNLEQREYRKWQNKHKLKRHPPTKESS